MGKDTMKLGDKVIEKADFYKDDIKLFKIEDIDLDKIRLSMKKKYGQKEGPFKY